MAKVPSRASQLLIKKHHDPLLGPGVVVHNVDTDDSFHFPLPPGPTEYHARLADVLCDWLRDLVLDYTGWLLMGGDDHFFDRLMDRLPPPDDPRDGESRPLPDPPKGPDGKAQEIIKQTERLDVRYR